MSYAWLKKRNYETMTIVVGLRAVLKKHVARIDAAITRSCAVSRCFRALVSSCALALRLEIFFIYTYIRYLQSACLQTPLKLVLSIVHQIFQLMYTEHIGK